ncbi:phosphatase 2C 47-like [Thraustotheca clavata]|uniref:protein-serine/threonine phosphatase n=1 Tax=Thraustotheca clavata TaxID=74557 RepID=A0A1V9Z6B7_9STRA|nr:phosphatase 2C 47-like [Thraustotheca clavata]
MTSQVLDRLKDEIEHIKREPYLWNVVQAPNLVTPKLSITNYITLSVRLCEASDIVLPHPNLIMEFAINANYGAHPPVVKCPGEWSHPMVHSKSRVVILNLLQRNEKGWCKSYSILTVLHAFRMTLRSKSTPWENRSPLLHRLEDKYRVISKEPTVAHCESAVACEMGTRSVMEDTYCFTDMFTNTAGNGDSLLGLHPALYCIADGHAGITCARFLVDNIQNTLSNELAKDKSVREALFATCLGLDARFEEAYAPYDDTSGSTLIALFYDGLDKMYCINVGDSRALLLRGDRVVQISRDHRCSDVEEKAYITDSGGFIQNDRTFGQLTVTRAFGDTDIKRAFGNSLAAFPEISEWTLTPELDEIFILACDGLYSVMDNHAIARFVNAGLVQKKSLTTIAKELTIHCVGHCGGEDNTTVILIQLRPDVALSPTKPATPPLPQRTTEDENVALVDTLLNSLELESSLSEEPSMASQKVAHKLVAPHKSTKVPINKAESKKVLENDNDLMEYLMDDTNFNENIPPL